MGVATVLVGLRPGVILRQPAPSITAYRCLHRGQRALRGPIPVLAASPRGHDPEG